MKFRMNILSKQICAFLPPRISGLLLSSSASWQGTAAKYGLTAEVGGVEYSVFCPLCLVREVPVHSGLESPNSQRQRRGGGGDGVSATASPEALGDPPNSGGRAGTRTRPQFPVSVGYFRPRAWWVDAGTYLVGGGLGRCWYQVSPPPLYQPPTLRGRSGARGLRGEFRCLTAASDPTSFGSDAL